MTPRETRVSIVVEPWRPAAKAALWNGHAPQVVTGIEARATTHCHPLNCRGGAIDKTRARIAKGAEIRRRCSRLSARSRAPSPTPGEEVVDEGVVSETAFGKEVPAELGFVEGAVTEEAFVEGAEVLGVDTVFLLKAPWS